MLVDLKVTTYCLRVNIPYFIIPRLQGHRWLKYDRVITCCRYERLLVDKMSIWCSWRHFNSKMRTCHHSTTTFWRQLHTQTDSYTYIEHNLGALTAYLPRNIEWFCTKNNSLSVDTKLLMEDGRRTNYRTRARLRRTTPRRASAQRMAQQ